MSIKLYEAWIIFPFNTFSSVTVASLPACNLEVNLDA